MKILALDLGTRTGWAIVYANGGVHTGYVDFKGDRFEGGGMRFLRFRQWLDKLGGVPEYVYYEKVRRHLGTDAAQIYGGWLTVLTSWCEEHGVPYQGLTVQEIKIFATGKGNANKGWMIEAATKATGRQFDDDNEADAYWIARLAMSQSGM